VRTHLFSLATLVSSVLINYKNEPIIINIYEIQIKEKLIGKHKIRERK
jgi:hypothetical protein